MLTLRLKSDPLRDYEAADHAMLRTWIEADLEATADDETIRRMWRACCRWAMCAGWTPPNKFEDRLRFAIFCREEGVIE